jgi:hypothetical protein
MPHNRKLKLYNLTIDEVSFDPQLQNVTLSNNTADGDKLFGYDGGESRTETDPDYALDLTFYADWRLDGISDFLTAHDGERLAWTGDHHPDIPAEHVRWSGFLTVKAPNVGGDVRTTEMTEITLQVEGKPVYARVGS